MSNNLYKFYKRIGKKVFKNTENINFPYQDYQIRNKCTFIHIPKTAGTSILDLIAGKGNYTRQHLPWYVYRNANPEFFKQSFKFAFTRNPWDRVYSTYCYFINGGDNKVDHYVSQKIQQFSGFNEFIINGLGKGYFRSHPLFLPQSNFIITHNDELIVDFMGRFENIEMDFEKIVRELNLKRKLDHVNKSKRQDSYMDAYHSPKAVKIIKNMYIEDIKRFDYEFN